MDSEWKDIPNHPGYQINKSGDVKSRKKILSACMNNAGYKLVCMYVHGKRKTEYIHRLMALAYGTVPSGKSIIVNHKNRDKLDNRIENLEWCSYEENFMHWKLTDASTDNVLTELQKLPKDQQIIIFNRWKEMLANDVR